MTQYNFLRDDWDGSPKIVWSRKKQDKLFKILITKYPTAKDLRKKLLDIGTEESYNLGKYINPNWNNDQYYRFITSNVIKYSDNGKIILSQLIGAGIGSGIGYGVYKYLYPSLPTPNEYKEKIASLKNDDEIHSYTNSVLDNIQKTNLIKSNIWKRSSPYAAAIGSKSLTSYGTYKLLDALDKKSNKKNA